MSTKIVTKKPVRKPRKTGPVATITGPAGEVKIYRTGPAFTLSYYVGLERKREKRATLEDAKDRAQKILTDHRSGRQHVRAVTAREAEVLNQVVEMLSPLSVSLPSAIREYVSAKTAVPGVDLLQAVKHFAADQERLARPQKSVIGVVAELKSALQSQGRSERYREDMGVRLNAFAKDFKVNVSSVRVAELDAWLIGLKVAPRTQNNYRACIATLFSYARNRGYLARDTKTEAELAMVATDRSSEIGIYSPDALRVMLEQLPLAFIAHVALGGLAGLRTSEIGRLAWKDINLPGKFIVVAADKAKTAQRRIVPICDALASWLAPLPRDTGLVRVGWNADRTFLRALGAALDNIGVESVNNGLRHSFASYRLASVKSAEQVALEMGNSPRKVFSNYRKLTTEAEATRWFSVEAITEKTVVNFKAA
jgi:integrase